MTPRENMMKRWTTAVLMGMVIATGCQPEVKIKAPDKPIVIDLNIKIEHEIRVRIEKDAEELINDKKGLF